MAAARACTPAEGAPEPVFLAPMQQRFVIGAGGSGTCLGKAPTNASDRETLAGTSAASATSKEA